MSRLKKLLMFFEDPQHPCLGPMLGFLKFGGIWYPGKRSPVARAKLAFYYFNMAFFLSQYLKCIISFNSESLQLILRYVPFHMGVVKTLLFQKNYKKWNRLINFVSREELREISTKDETQNNMLKDYVSRSRRVTYFFWTLAFLSNISIFTEPYQKNQIVENGTSVYTYLFDAYTPFKKQPPGYYYSMFIQTVLGNMMTTYIIAWDMLVVSIMIFFAGQLRIIGLYCERAIDSENPGISHRNIVECHQYHITLVQYQKEFGDLISTPMFIYLIVISVNLSVCIMQLAEIEDDLPTVVSGIMFIFACLIQLLLFYWHSNEVTVESELVSYSTFKSNWVEADKRIQKEVALLGLTTTKRLTFKAGPYNEMTLATFIAILRTSYSFYTLLKGTN